MTPEDETYEPDEYRPPGDALMLETGKANRMNNFLKNNFGRISHMTIQSCTLGDGWPSKWPEIV